MSHSIIKNVLDNIVNEIITNQSRKRKITDDYWELKCPGKGCNEMIPYYRQACGKYFCLNESVKL